MEHYECYYMGSPILSGWAFNPAEPSFVRVSFGDGSVAWELSRETIRRAIHGEEPETLEGSVHVSVYQHSLIVLLQGREGEATIAFRLKDIESFLVDTYRAVSRTDEALINAATLESALARLLRDAG